MKNKKFISMINIDGLETPDKIIRKVRSELIARYMLGDKVVRVDFICEHRKLSGFNRSEVRTRERPD